MKVLGYNGGLDGYPSSFDTGHNAAAALLIHGKLVAACEEERFTRTKHDAQFPKHAVNYVLREGGLKDVTDVDLITYYFSYPLMFHPEKYRSLASQAHRLERPLLWLPNTAMKWFNKFAGYNNHRSRRVFEKVMGVEIPPEKFRAVPHHLCHLASSFYESPFERALCVTLDGEGESASGLVATASGTKIKILNQTYAPNSLGYLYSFITLFLGFDKHDEYKVMGLAPYGDPKRFRSYFESILTQHLDGSFTVAPGLILHLMARDALLRKHQQIFYPPSLTRALGAPRRPDEPCTQRHMDIAAALQESLETVVLNMLTHLQARTQEKNLCMAGGVALNCTLNGKIARSGLFESVWIHPAAHDAGTAVGGAYYGYHNLLGRERRQSAPKVYLGPQYSPTAVEIALRDFRSKIKCETSKDIFQTAAAAIAQGKVVGWFQGRMEWGPRALGNRSILADARRDEMKDVVNHAVKLREGFRPFAPACLADHAAEWFDMTGLKTSPYMLFVVPVRDERRNQIPAVTHVDGTARVQTVSMVQNEKFYRLLTAFHQLTGVPLVLNTSFNVKGEPIVNTPQDALRCFLNTQIDLLVLDDVVVSKREEVERRYIAEAERQKFRTGRVIDGQVAW